MKPTFERSGCVIKLPPLALSIKDAGAMLGVRRSKAYELARKGVLRTIRVGSDRKVLVESIYAFVERQRITDDEPDAGGARRA